MKITKLTTLIAIILLFSCKSEKNKETNKKESKKEIASQSNTNANYSSLFDTYNCNISIKDLSKVFQIPASDITLSKNSKKEKCIFQLKGFGEGYENTGTKLRFGPSFSTKKNNQKVITKSLKEKSEMPNGKMVAGRDIVLADEGDCYIMIQSLHGRVLILNENYKQLFMISYGSKASVQGRTKTQQDELADRAKFLANYLITKHKK